MPLYDYVCQSCGSEKEIQHPMSEVGRIQVLCQECSKPMIKQLSVPTLIGFDNVGRSISSKDKTESASKDAPKVSTESSKDAPKAPVESKSTASKDAA